ncbi:MAG: hypothetical protein ACHQNT_09850 [Bacteroidia bacterium]
MKRPALTLAFFLLVIFKGHSQSMNDDKKSNVYSMGASELIFSFGDVKDPNLMIDPIVRFTVFFHYQHQFHYDFNAKTGLYFGLGVRNVGFINTLNDSIKIKQRSYSLGIPLAFKIGSMQNKTWLAVGGEAEMMFAYKQKVFYADQEFKNNEWFSDKVNIFNPSVFAEIHFKGGSYLRFKYYLMDFLQEDKQDVKLFGVPFAYHPESSKLFYVAIGTAINHKDYRKLNKMRNKTT